MTLTQQELDFLARKRISDPSWYWKYGASYAVNANGKQQSTPAQEERPSEPKENRRDDNRISLLQWISRNSNVIVVILLTIITIKILSLKNA